jgi:hypothetical protein
LDLKFGSTFGALQTLGVNLEKLSSERWPTSPHMRYGWLIGVSRFHFRFLKQFLSFFSSFFIMFSQNSEDFAGEVH